MSASASVNPCVLLLLVPALSVLAQPAVSSFSYLGCYVDQAPPNRQMRGLEGLDLYGPYSVSVNDWLVHITPQMTVELCSRICSFGRFRFFAVESREFCGCAAANGSWVAANESDCSHLCVGNSSQKCGGDWRMSLYQNFYRPQGSCFTRVNSLPEQLSAVGGYSIPGFWSVAAVDRFRCALACSASSDCLGCAFVQSSQMCRLLRFAAVPTGIAAETGWVWMKV